MEFLNSVMEFLVGHEGMVATLAVVVEFVLRLVPSEKPKSIVYLVAGAIKSVGAILSKIGEMLDKILPQNVKE